MAGGVTAAPDVSIVLVNYNTRAILERTVEAVRADLRGIHAEIIVVDNASSDGSAALVRERFPGVRLLENAENRFYAAGNNQGLAASRGRHVLLLNPDAEPRPGTIPAMLADMTAHREAGILSCRLSFPDGRLQRNCSRRRSYAQLLLEYTPLGLLFPGRRRRVLATQWYDGWDRTTSREVDVVPGSCLLVRREVLESVGGLDERLRMYFAEDDWCLRIRAAGFQVRYAAVGDVIHPEGASVRQAAALARRMYFEDLVRYTRKHFGLWRAAALWLLSRPTRWALDAAGAWRRK